MYKLENVLLDKDNIADKRESRIKGEYNIIVVYWAFKSF